MELILSKRDITTKFHVLDALKVYNLMLNLQIELKLTFTYKYILIYHKQIKIRNKYNFCTSRRL